MQSCMSVFCPPLTLHGGDEIDILAIVLEVFNRCGWYGSRFQVFIRLWSREHSTMRSIHAHHPLSSIVQSEHERSMRGLRMTYVSIRCICMHVLHSAPTASALHFHRDSPSELEAEEEKNDRKSCIEPLPVMALSDHVHLFVRAAAAAAAGERIHPMGSSEGCSPSDASRGTCASPFITSRPSLLHG
jgi:hypothetical protein